MSYVEVEYPRDKEGFYAMLRRQLALYMGDETDQTARLANASAVIAQAFPDANWVGFYLVDGDSLAVGPFQGKPAVSRIGFGKGVYNWGILYIVPFWAYHWFRGIRFCI